MVLKVTHDKVTLEDMLRRFDCNLYSRLNAGLKELRDASSKGQSSHDLRGQVISLAIYGPSCYYCYKSLGKCNMCPALENNMCGLDSITRHPIVGKITRLHRAYVKGDRKRFEKLRTEILAFVLKYDDIAFDEYVVSKKDRSDVDGV